MNNLCRTAAALQFSCGITWHVRHIETKRNIADGPSRLFEKGSRGLSDRRAYRVECQSSEGSGFSREASAPSKHLKPRREHVETAFPNAQGRYFLEIFSGTGRLTDAVAKCGVPVLEPLDYINGPHCDLRRRKTQELVLSWIDRGVIGFVHLGTPCTIWSRARHNVKDSPATRLKEETGIELALFTCEVIRRCNSHGIPYALENPRCSKLFMFEPLVMSICQGPNQAVDFEMCQFGEPYQKRARIITSVGWLNHLARRCNHKTHSTWLKGQVQPEQSWQARVCKSNRSCRGISIWFLPGLCTISCRACQPQIRPGQPSSCHLELFSQECCEPQSSCHEIPKAYRQSRQCWAEQQAASPWTIWGFQQILRRYCLGEIQQRRVASDQET